MWHLLLYEIWPTERMSIGLRARAAGVTLSLVIQLAAGHRVTPLLCCHGSPELDEIAEDVAALEPGIHDGRPELCHNASLTAPKERLATQASQLLTAGGRTLDLSMETGVECVAASQSAPIASYSTLFANVCKAHFGRSMKRAKMGGFGKTWKLRTTDF